MMNRFRDGFLIGAATAAHQVEGNNVNSDCWVMENVPGSLYKEPSLDAADHYNRYEDDIKIMADAGLNAYRFSIEWARIEPTKGKFDEDEIEHYRKVLECCYKNNITPVVTLHHFSSPKWLISEGGWEDDKTVHYFEDYCRYVVEKLGGMMPYICTINEANMGLQIKKIMDKYAKGIRDREKNVDIQVGLNKDVKVDMKAYYEALGEAFGIEPMKAQPFVAPRTAEGDKIVMRCHERARQVIKDINPDIKVGITLSLVDYHVLPGGERFALADQEEDFLHYLPYLQGDDFLGVQNYTRQVYGPNGVLKPAEGTKLTKMGYEYYPEALSGVVRFVSKHWDKPIMVTENGISTDNDADRVDFIERALKGLYQCMEDGIEVIGYMHWSLLDNFEWQLGYEQKFGLIAVDRATQSRYPKRSLKCLGDINKYGI
jgi:beta-glucosidase